MRLHASQVWTPQGVLTDHVVRIGDGLIVEVSPASRHPPADVVLPRHLLMPGLVNAHSHAFQRAFRGHVQWKAEGRDDFWSWRDRMYRTANELPPEGVEAVTALAFLEMAESGITTVGEFHYLHHQPDGTPYADPDELSHRVMAAAEAVGVHLCLLRVAYGRGGPHKPPDTGQRRFVDPNPDSVLASLERLSQAMGPTVRVGLAAHSVRALDAAWLEALSAWPGVVHAHVSEQPAENATCMGEHGRSPLAVLHDAGLVHSRFCAVHLTHPMDGDLELLRDAGGRVCVCPTTEMDLGDGWLPVTARRELPTCLGSDSQAAIDLWWEARTLELHGRAESGRRNVLATAGDRHSLATHLLRAATVEGDRALGGAGAGIAVGAPADLVAVDLDRPAADGVPVLEAAAFVARPEWVERLWVAGRPVVVDGHHPNRRQIREAAAPWLPASG